ncbi:MAG: TIGR03936 family radical SAM-associated protein [Oscillospiraceae bacterium]
MPEKLRLRFEKTGRAIYISHLDLMRTMQRVFLRADCPLKYSEGFNPHALISILLPLSVGVGSVCELMDFQLREDVDLAALPERLTAVMPEGIRALEAYPAGRKVRELKWLRVTGRYEYDRADPAEMAQKLSAFYARDAIVITRKTKRGEGQMDIVPAIAELHIRPEETCVTVEAVVSAQEPTLNPDHLVAALQQLAPELAPDFAAFTRQEVYTEDMQIFR